MSTPTPSITSLRADFEEWIDREDGLLRGDGQILTAEEWADRGEVIGHGACLTMLLEGSPLYRALNYGEPSWAYSEQLDEIASRHGFFWEIGFAWSLHFYPASPDWLREAGLLSPDQTT